MKANGYFFSAASAFFGMFRVNLSLKSISTFLTTDVTNQAYILPIRKCTEDVLLSIKHINVGIKKVSKIDF